MPEMQIRHMPPGTGTSSHNLRPSAASLMLSAVGQQPAAAAPEAGKPAALAGPGPAAESGRQPAGSHGTHRQPSATAAFKQRPAYCCKEAGNDPKAAAGAAPGDLTKGRLDATPMHEVQEARLLKPVLRLAKDAAGSAAKPVATAKTEKPRDGGAGKAAAGLSCAARGAPAAEMPWTSKRKAGPAMAPQAGTLKRRKRQRSTSRATSEAPGSSDAAAHHIACLRSP